MLTKTAMSFTSSGRVLGVKTASKNQVEPKELRHKEKEACARGGKDGLDECFWVAAEVVVVQGFLIANIATKLQHI